MSLTAPYAHSPHSRAPPAPLPAILPSAPTQGRAGQHQSAAAQRNRLELYSFPGSSNNTSRTDPRHFGSDGAVPAREQVRVHEDTKQDRSSREASGSIGAKADGALDMQSAAAAASLLGLSCSVPHGARAALEAEGKDDAMDVDAGAPAHIRSIPISHPRSRALSGAGPQPFGFSSRRSRAGSMGSTDVGDGDGKNKEEDEEEEDEDEEDELAFDDDDEGGGQGEEGVESGEGEGNTAPTSVESHVLTIEGEGETVKPEVKQRVEGEGAAEGEAEAEAEGEDGRDGKRHTCPHCHKRFNRPSSLKIHLNTHTGEKPFECPYPGCGRQFNVSSNMRRHYRNHSSPAGLGPASGSAPGPGVSISAGSAHAYGHGQYAYEQSRRDASGQMAGNRHAQGYRPGERERHPHDEGYVYGLRSHLHQQAAPSAYRGQAHGFGGSREAGHELALSHHRSARAHAVQHQQQAPPPFGAYPPHHPSAGAGYTSHEVELERGDRLERMGRMERERLEHERARAAQAYPAHHPSHAPYASATSRVPPQLPHAYPHSPPHPRERHVDYGVPGARTQALSHTYSHQQPHAYAHTQAHPPHAHLSQSQHQPQSPASAHVLHNSHSFSHPHPQSHPHPYPHPHAHERYASTHGSPSLSPALSSASSLPTSSWPRERGHAHTHSAPAFAGAGASPGPSQSTFGLLLPPGTHPGVRQPGRMTQTGQPATHGRSHSYSTSSAYPPSSFEARMQGMRTAEREWAARSGSGGGIVPDTEKWERRERRDSTAARTGHESELEGVPDSASEFDGRDMEDEDVDMREDGVEEVVVGGRFTKVGNGRPIDNGAGDRRWFDALRGERMAQAGINEDGPSRSTAHLGSTLPRSPVTPDGPHFHALPHPRPSPDSRYPVMEKRYSPPSAEEVGVRHPAPVSAPIPVPGPTSRRERAHSYSHSHSRTGSSSSSGHGHGVHPYARPPSSRHGHSLSRETGARHERELPPLPHSSVSPRTSGPGSASASASASVSASASASASSVSSPRQMKGGVIEDPPSTPRNIRDAEDRKQATSPSVPAHPPSQFPVYTYPPPVPPPGHELAAGLPGRAGAGTVKMEVEVAMDGK
ncbi:hypothetical protein M0805_007817 [Coniferiporia weirii]|nr:hypothetical protein M0805_007817 [Coniferiporia weirii]